MNVYDTANKLAYEMKNSEEYKKYKEAKDQVMQNPEMKAKIRRSGNVDLVIIDYLQLISCNRKVSNRVQEPVIPAMQAAPEIAVAPQMMQAPVFNEEVKPIVNNPAPEYSISQLKSLSNTIESELSDLENKTYEMKENINQSRAALNANLNMYNSAQSEKREEFVDESFTIELPKLRSDDQNK